MAQYMIFPIIINSIKGIINRAGSVFRLPSFMNKNKATQNSLTTSSDKNLEQSKNNHSSNYDKSQVHNKSDTKWRQTIDNQYRHSKNTQSKHR